MLPIPCDRNLDCHINKTSLSPILHGTKIILVVIALLKCRDSILPSTGTILMNVLGGVT